MKRRFLVVSMLAAFLLAAGSVRAQNVDDKIQALERELSQLKEQQIELKKEATAAAAAMPTFSYRPGNGVFFEAADKSWSLRHSFEAHMRYNFLAGRDQVGRSNGELEGRRFRPEFYICINNCLWQVDWRLDLDGFGGNTDLQRGVIYFAAEQFTPWLPTVQFGMDTTNSGPVSRSRQGSGSVGAQAEYDMLSQNNGFNTGSASYGMTWTWDDRSLEGIGIPGRISRLQVGMNAYGEGGDGAQLNTDRKDFATYLSVEPFSALKNKWIRGFLFEYGAWWCNVDGRALANGCARVRVRDNARGNGRQTLFDTGNNTIGDGLWTEHGPGLLWSIGPYTLRSMMMFQRGEDGAGNGAGSILAASTRGKKRGRVFLIGHDLFLWSPKGFLTGSASTTGSILAGYHFERVDQSIDCGAGTSVPSCASLGGHLGQFHRNAIRLNEWDLWYFIAPRMSVGVNLLWYDAKNLRNGANQAAHNLGVCDTPVTTANCRAGKGGDWVDVFLNWRYTF
ncbi:MAG TPA: hypothetical protein VEB61_00040 [Candidatus Binatia bacterium]|nr:hypothetical protein [Candidatus Binatia bacterium]